MNINQHMAKLWRAINKKESWNQFFMTLVATTISIALTFGTTAIIDNQKKENDKQEIVMMVMYDMYRSLKSVEQADSMIQEAMELQLQIALDTTKFDELYMALTVSAMPEIEYTETTEHIFSSSIETINTIGNVLFTETVAEFYSKRSLYNTAICDSISKNYIKTVSTFSNLNEVLSFSFYNYAILSGGLLTSMQQLFALSKQMMDISDEDLAVYSKEREKIEQTISEGDTIRNKMFNKVMQLNYQIEAAKAKTIEH